MDKWDYLRSPIIEKNFVSSFEIGEVELEPAQFFLAFIFIFDQFVVYVPNVYFLYSLHNVMKSFLEEVYIRYICT